MSDPVKPYMDEALPPVEVARAADAVPGMTIDELAEKTGATVRTLRLYQTKALLPPPQIIGRIGYYSDAHINRLSTIERMQARGFSLAGIGEIIRMWEEGQGIDELLAFERILAAPFTEETDMRVSAEDLPERFPAIASSDELRKKALELGLFEPDGDRGFIVATPNLLQFGAVLTKRGVPPGVMLEELGLLQEDLARVAARFIALFRTYIFPNVVSDRPEEWLPRIARYEKLYVPAMRTLVAALFAQEMKRVIKKARIAVERIAGVEPPNG